MLFLNDSGTFQSDITRFSLRVRIVFQDKIQYFLFNVKPYFTNPYWHLYSRNLRRDSYLPYLPRQLYLLTKTASTIHKHTHTDTHTHTHIVSRLTCSQNFHLEFVSSLISTVTSAQQLIGINVPRTMIYAMPHGFVI